MPGVRSQAAIRKIREDVERQAKNRITKRLQAGGVTDVLAEFEKLIEEAVVFKDVCRERVGELTAIRYEGKAGEQLRSEVAVYERALDRCEKVLSSGVRLGLAARRQELDEAETMMLVSVVRSILNRLELTKDQQIAAGRVVPEELRALSSTKVESVKVISSGR